MKKAKRFATWILLFLLSVSAISVHAQQVEEDSVQNRITKAKENGLADWIDEEGYLVDAYFKDKSDSELSALHIDGLVRTWSEEELDAYVSNLNDGIASYEVTFYQKVSQINPSTGRTLYTGVFQVDGILAYCIERSVTTPAKGSVTGEWQTVTNDNLRKVLYYGYNGPEAVGYTYVETALAAGEANGDGDNSLGRNVLSEIQSKPSPPSNFKVWKVETNNGRTQDLAFYTLEQNGYGQVKKVSGNSSVTDGNNCYSLQGAVYGVYSNAACTSEVGRVSTDVNGLSGTISLPAGTYYVREITSPKGYLLSSEVKSMTISASNTTTVTMTDAPQTITPDKFIQKLDSETGQAKGQGRGTLSGAQFAVKFYKGNYEKGVNPADKGATPDKQWLFETDESGLIRFQNTYLVSGNSFWTDSRGNVILPYGTITMQEIWSSNGYRVNPTMLIQKIEPGTRELELQKVSEEVVKLELVKYREGTTEPLAGAVFEHVCPDGTVEEQATNSHGKIIWKGLQRGTHRIREVSAPQGYPKNRNEIVFVVNEQNKIIVTSEADDTLGAIRTQLTEKGDLYIEVEDKLGFRLPETGYAGAGAYSILGIVVCIFAVKGNQKKKGKGVI